MTSALTVIEADGVLADGVGRGGRGRETRGRDLVFGDHREGVVIGREQQRRTHHGTRADVAHCGGEAPGLASKINDRNGSS